MNWPRLLRQSEPPIISRVEEGRVLLDLRTVFPEQDSAIASVLNRITSSNVAESL